MRSQLRAEVASVERTGVGMREKLLPPSSPPEKYQKI
jgi:hypothetical protein